MTTYRTSSRPSLYARLFERQLLHVLLLGGLLSGVWFLSRHPAVTEGELWSLPGGTWLWIVIASAILHQGFVWIAWRLELHAGAITRAFPEAGFRLFRLVFAVLGLSRFLIAPLAFANRCTLELPGVLQWGLSAVLLMLSGYLFYSVLRYFGIDRAAGLDHFNPDARTWPFVEEGIFRYTSNGMYIFGFLVLWVPGLALESAGALLAAAFHHAYIWVHYYCTEKPDMEHIYRSGHNTD